MMIKYCEPCQLNSTHKLDKCPHEMTSIPIQGKVWSQIGENLQFKYYRHGLISRKGAKCNALSGLGLVIHCPKSNFLISGIDLVCPFTRE